MPAENVYLQLTRDFNVGRLRAVICSGQAVVLHHLAVMSKDGDWILKESDEALSHVRRVLSARGATYRFGAPLDLAWMQGGWSAHAEFHSAGQRVRTDFFTRPPRVSAERLARVWEQAEDEDVPFVDLVTLALMKETNRERDYAVIGDLARLMKDPRDVLRHSRSARDLLAWRAKMPELFSEAEQGRPALRAAADGREALEVALDAERRTLIRANEARLARYLHASRSWREAWPLIEHEIRGLSLEAAHEIVVSEATRLLPTSVEP